MLIQPAFTFPYPTPNTDQEKLVLLYEHEAVIRRNEDENNKCPRRWAEEGGCLAHTREARLYEPLGFRDFPSYCQARTGMRVGVVDGLIAIYRLSLSYPMPDRYIACWTLVEAARTPEAAWKAVMDLLVADPGISQKRVEAGKKAAQQALAQGLSAAEIAAAAVAGIRNRKRSGSGSSAGEGGGGAVPVRTPETLVEVVQQCQMGLVEVESWVEVGKALHEKGHRVNLAEVGRLRQRMRAMFEKGMALADELEAEALGERRDLEREEGNQTSDEPESDAPEITVTPGPATATPPATAATTTTTTATATQTATQTETETETQTQTETPEDPPSDPDEPWHLPAVRGVTSILTRNEAPRLEDHLFSVLTGGPPDSLLAFFHGLGPRLPQACRPVLDQWLKNVADPDPVHRFHNVYAFFIEARLPGWRLHLHDLRTRDLPKPLPAHLRWAWAHIPVVDDPPPDPVPPGRPAPEAELRAALADLAPLLAFAEKVRAAMKAGGSVQCLPQEHLFNEAFDLRRHLQRILERCR
jgi:hypothetical protein